MKKILKRVLIISLIIITILAVSSFLYVKIAFKTPDYAEKFESTIIVDIHNHDASHYYKSLFVWNQYNIDKIVLFGNISEPSAMETDKQAWIAYNRYPDRFYPFFAAINTYSDECLEYVKNNLELGYYGIGEIMAASQFSPFANKTIWKAENPMDGYLPEIYEICAEYKAPLLLHIDPPSQKNIDALELALDTYPDTTFILAHVNVYNSNELVDSLLSAHDNLYMDLFVGFVNNPECHQSLDDYAEIIKKYPDRFMVSSDSAYDITYEDAYKAIYDLFELLDDETVEKIAHLNFEQIIEQQPMTQSQIETIQEICNKQGIDIVYSAFNKIEANEFIIAHQ